MENGYEFFGKHRHMVTVFTAKNYCNEFDNDGACLDLDGELKAKFHVFKYIKKDK